MHPLKTDPPLRGTQGERLRRCPTCRTLYPDEDDASNCPVCHFRRALELGLEDGSGLPGEGPLGLDDDRYDHYELARRDDEAFDELGRGTMGVTYKAFDTVLGNAVALKVIDVRVAALPGARERFLREARAAARLRHPNVASVFYYGVRKSDGQCFYAMELVEGETLEARLRREGQLPVPLALEVAAQVARALAAAEDRGLVHRDLKPSNLMLAEGLELTVKVIDFGLAKAVEAGDETELTHGGFVGTPAFASPEQCAAANLDVRSDLYALGVTLWQMLSGRTPFRGSRAEVVGQHLHAPLPLDQLHRVPQPLVVLLEVLLEKDPARRFQKAAQLLQATTMVKAAIDAGCTLTRQRLQKGAAAAPFSLTRKSLARRGPKKISVARLPVTGKEVFGREDNVAFLEAAWANPHANVVSVVAWAGVGKSSLVNHWLRRMAAERYRSAELVFGWSFYRQGTSAGVSSADEFLDTALAWFDDPDPRIGTAWEKGERLASLIARRRTLIILDGLEPLQNPPGAQEGRLRAPSLQALLRDLAAFNRGLCVITTRLAVGELAEHEGNSVLRCDLEHLSGDASAQLLRALGVKGPETELRRAGDEFGGHGLALTLLGSYLTDAYHGDIRCREEVSNRLAQDVRQGGHARKVMESYQSWFGEGPELAVLRLLGFFDRPVDEKALAALRKPPVIPCLTESLTDLRPSEWRTVLARLRRARLLAEEDPHHPGRLDAHPLVREYFGDQLRSQRTEAWQEGNRRLYFHYQALAPALPDNFRDMEPLFLAVICGCQAGRFHDALHEVYLPRIQRGDASFAANFLGARGTLLSVLGHFFARGRWGSPLQTSLEGQDLTAEDQLIILMQAGMYLTATRGLAAPDVRTCYECVETLCYSLNRPLLLYVALMGQWRYSCVTDKLTTTMQIAQRVYLLAQKQADTVLMIGACHALAGTSYFLGDFEAARHSARRGVQLWRSRGLPSPAEEVIAPAVVCLCREALCEWHFGAVASCHANMAEAVALTKDRNDTQLAESLFFAALLAHLERNPLEVERLASALVELSARHHFALWLAGGAVLRGWARSVSGETEKGILWIEDGIGGYRATGSMLGLPFALALKAEALHLAGRTYEALEVIKEAEALVESSEERWWLAELHRLRGVLLAAVGAEETQIATAFHEAIRIARQQKSASLMQRAEASCAAYCGRK